jgi:hypothetical protein
MFNVLPPLLIVLGIVGLIFVFKSQKDEKIIQEIEEGEIINKKEGFLEKFHRVFNKENYQKACNQFFLFIEKSLVRSRIIILRIDRTIFKNLANIRKRKNNDDLKDGENGIVKFFNEGKLDQDDIDTSHILDTKDEEKKLLKKLEKNPDDIATLKNLARIYLWQEDFSSARWILLQAYRIDKEDNVVQGLLIELYEKKAEDNKKPR